MMRCLAAYVALLCAVVAVQCNTPNNDGLSVDEKRARIDTMYADYKAEFAKVPDVTPAEVEALRTMDDAVVVDVRTPEERAVAVIPGAISQEEFEAKKGTFKDRPVITHCTIGYRSGVYAEELAAEGYKAYNLAGSILAWVHAGYPVIDPDTGEPTKRVHTYGPDWDLLPDGYEAVW